MPDLEKLQRRPETSSIEDGADITIDALTRNLRVHVTVRLQCARFTGTSMHLYHRNQNASPQSECGMYTRNSGIYTIWLT